MNYEDIAKRLKIYVLGTGNMYIETNFAGQLVAPEGDVIIGQAGKHHHGSVYAKSIVIHQNTKFTWVPYVESATNTTIARINEIYNVEFF